VQSRPAGPVSTKTKDAWVLALAVILPLLSFVNCSARGACFAPEVNACLIGMVPPLVCTAICAWLVRRSRIGVILFLIYGGLLSFAPELYWRPQDRAFYEKVMAMKADGEPTDWVSVSRGFPSSGWSVNYSDGEFWMLD